MASWEVASVNKPEPFMADRGPRLRGQSWGKHRAGSRSVNACSPPTDSGLAQRHGCSEGRGGSGWCATGFWAPFRHVVIMFGATVEAPFKADMPCQSKQLTQNNPGTGTILICVPACVCARRDAKSTDTYTSLSGSNYLILVHKHC